MIRDQVEMLSSGAPERARGKKSQPPTALERLVARIRVERLLALVVFLVAMALDLHRVWYRNLTFDESFSVGLASRKVDVILAAGWGNEAHMTLYYIMLHDVMAIASSMGIASTETVVRLISVISAAIGAVALFLLAWRFMGRWAAVVATGLYLGNFHQLWYAQLTRSYALQLMLACLSWYALVYALVHASRYTPETPRRVRALWWTIYVVATTICIYSQIFSVLVVAAQALAVVLICFVPGAWRSLARRQLKAFLISQVAIGLLSGLILADGVVHGGNNGWVPDATPGAILPTLLVLIHNMWEGIYGVLGVMFIILIAAMCLYALLAPWLGRRLAEMSCAIEQLAVPGDEWASPSATPGGASDDQLPMPRYAAVIFAACWFVVPFALAYLGTMPIHNSHLFFERYLGVILPGLFLLVGLGVQSLPHISLRFVLAFWLLTIVVVTIPRFYDTYRPAGAWDVRAAVQWMEQRYKPGDGIVCLPAFICSFPVSYYLKVNEQLGSGHARFDNSPGQFHFDPPWLSRATPDAIQKYASTHTRLFVITIDYGNSDMTPWFNQHYHFQSSYKVTQVKVQLYDTTSPSPSTSAPGNTPMASGGVSARAAPTHNGEHSARFSTLATIRRQRIVEGGW